MADKTEVSEQLEDRNGSDEEKQTGIAPVPELEGKEGLRTVDEGYSPDQVVTQFSELEERRIMNKVDWHLVPLLSVLYL
jgi:MFS transporter, ACS family, DAL5 transporter family protein